MNKAKSAIKDVQKELRTFMFRGRLLLVGALFLMFVLLGRMAYLQVFQYDLYSLRSERNRISFEAIPPTRGLIYDRNGNLLAANQPSYSLTLTRELSPDYKQVIAKVCELLEQEETCYTELLTRSLQRRPFEPELLLDQLTEEQIARLAVNRHLLPGIEISAHLLRHYPRGEAASHALGYVGRISEDDLLTLDKAAYSGTHYLGKTGIERFYEPLLHGKVGYRKIETNARGRLIQVVESQPPQPGIDLTLHLDAQLQENIYKMFAGRRGAAVAIEPQTGGLLALVSSPGYDPNIFLGLLGATEFNRIAVDPKQPLFDRASRGQYSPGSSIKPQMGIAGLDAGVITRDFEIFDRGYYQLPNDERLYRNWRRSGHGDVNLARAIEVSNNTYFYNLAYLLGIDEISSFMERFGFGKSTALDVHAARHGLMPSREWKRQTRKEIWFPGETLSTGIGQGYWLVTPLQLATATAHLANKGKWVAPRFLASTAPEVTSLGQNLDQQTDLNLKDQANWDYMFDAMTQVMHGKEGTARFSGLNSTYKIAGKTGTAQVYSLSQDSNVKAKDLPEHLKDHAIFVGFAPVHNPQIALAIVVEHSGGGSQVAAPLAREIFDSYLLQQLDIAKEP